MQDFYFRGVWRMDWGLGNPNKTATLIATLMIAVWLLAYVRRWGFWAALTLFAGLGVCLVHTISRGGMVALLCGMGVVLWKVPRPWPRARIFGVLAVVGIMAGASFYFQAHDRFGLGIVQEDGSITARLKIWKEVPRMMVDAPGGWGRNQATGAFMQWYQKVDAPQVYLNLVNSHFTWMVEMNWFWRFCYLAGWGAVLLLCWPSKKLPWLIVLFGVWLAYAVGSIFTHVAENPWTWIVPGLAFLTALAARLWRKTWPGSRSWTALAGVAAALIAILWLTGSRSVELPIRGSSRMVILGRGEPTVWVVADPKVLGQNYGKTLRRFLQKAGGPPMPTVAVVRTMEDIGLPGAGTLVIAGGLSEPGFHALSQRLATQGAVLLLNPTFYPQEIGATPETPLKNVTAFFGEFSQSPALSAWGSQATVRQVEVAGDFLPLWPELILPPNS